MDQQIRRRLNMSDNRGAFECECREPGVYGSCPDRECPYCDGTGYTNDAARKKDWIKNPPPDMDY